LWTRSDDDRVLLLSFHHIVCDAWSIDLLLQELGTLYAAFAAGNPSPLPQPVAQYADYAWWQRRYLQAPELADRVRARRKALAGMPTRVRLPATKPLDLPPPCTAELRAEISPPAAPPTRPLSLCTNP